MKSAPKVVTLLFENFDDGVADNWEVKKGLWKVKDYSYSSDGNEEDIVTVGDENWKDYILEFKIKMISGDDNSIWFRFISNSGYGLQWYKQQLHLINIKPGNATNVIEPISWNYTLNRWYNLKISVKGPNIKVEIDGEEVINTFDTSFSSGKIGFRMVKSKTYIDDVKIYSYT
jgi:hypothetical protein